MQARRLSLALALVAALVAAGCGGGSSDNEAGPANAGTRIAKRSAPNAGKDDAYKAAGQIVADSGFRPEKDGFSFENYGPGYQDLGPAEMQDLFGSKVCASGAGAQCVLTPPAQAWMNEANKSAAGGHCYGFSLFSLKVFDHLLNPADYGAPTIRGLTLPGNVPLQSRLAESWAVQITPKVLLADRFGTPNEILDQLISALKNHPDTYTLLIFKRGFKDGHAITPFAVEDKGGGHFSVLLYDNNYPGITRAAQFDRNKNTWSYEASINPQQHSFLYEGDAQSQTTFLSPTSATIGLQPCPFCPAPPGVPAPRPASYEQVALNGDAVNHAHLLLTDSKGRRTGYVGDRLVQEIPGVRVMPIATSQNWLLKPEPHFLVPKGMKVTISVDGSTLRAPDNEAVSVIAPGRDALVSGLTVRPRERQTVNLAPGGKTLTYKGEGSQAPAIELGFAGAGRNESFSVATHKLEPGATLKATADTSANRLRLASSGTGRLSQAVVNFRSVGRSGAQVLHSATLRGAKGTCHLGPGAHCKPR